MRIVVGAVAGVFAPPVRREGNAERDQAEEAAERSEGFRQGEVPVHRAAGEVVLRHRARRVRGIRAGRLLVIGLLVRSGVAGGAHVHPLGDEEDEIRAPGPCEGEGSVQARRAAPHDEGGHGEDGTGKSAAQFHIEILSLGFGSIISQIRRGIKSCGGKAVKTPPRAREIGCGGV